MNLLLLVLPAIIALALSLALTPLAMRVALRVGAIDQPGERKVHTSPIPRMGGIAVLASVVTVLTVLAFLGGTRTLHHDVLIPLFVGLLPVLAISVTDDIRSLPSLPKFAAHLLGASIAVTLGIRLSDTIHLFGSEIHLGWIAIPLSIIWIAGVTNAFNIVDGLDGLSAGLALISALSLAGVSIVVGRFEMASAALVLGGALLGFLPYNTHPARVFLGDSGAASVGFLLACFALRGGSTLSAGMAILVPIVVLGVPLAETLVSMTRRLLRRLEGEASGGMFEADRRHFHHRLLDMGIDHRKAVLLLYGIGVFLAICAFASLALTASYAAILVGTLLVAAFIGIGRLNYDEFALIRRGYVLRMYDAPMLRSTFFVVFVDLAMAVVALYGAIALKYDDWSIRDHRQLALDLLVVLPPVILTVFWTFRLYRGAWKLASLDDFLRSTTAALIATGVAFSILAFLLRRDVSITFALVFLMLFGFATNSMRLSYRLIALWTQRSASRGEPVLIYGAGVAGMMALRELLSNPDNWMRPVGFVDDDERLVGRVIQGFRVHPSGRGLASSIRETGARGVIVSSSKVPAARVEEIHHECERLNVWVRHFSVNFSDVASVERSALNQAAGGWRLPISKGGNDTTTHRDHVESV